MRHSIRIAAALLGLAAAAPVSPSQGAACNPLSALAGYGMPVPGGGTLSPTAFANPATINAAGKIAFFSDVLNAPRNQGIFVADSNGLTPIAMGCGGGGGSGNPGSGCGDPSPIGGTFSGFFGGTFFTPDINAAGDVLFLADVTGGTAPRGLFLYRAATSTIVKVAAVGDLSPIGGTFGAVGPGSLNDSGVVVFLASNFGSSAANDYRWQNGVVSTIAAVGNPAPGGGVYQILGSETLGFVDGTTIPVGPLPDINASGQIAFRAILSGGITGRGILIWTNGTLQWSLKQGDALPGGGTCFDLWSPIINASGAIAIFADVLVSPGVFTSAWYVGSTGGWRRAMGFYDPVVGGGTCVGLAVSRNPMQPLDDDGHLVIWANAELTPGGAQQERMIVSGADGNQRLISAQSNPAPFGGSIGFFDAWPSINKAGKAAIGSTNPGGPFLSLHAVASGFLTWQNLGFGLAGASGVPRMTGAGSLTGGSAGTLALDNAAPGAPAWLVVGGTAAFSPIFGGTLVPSPDSIIVLPLTSPFGNLSFPWASWPSGIPACTNAYVQFWIFDPSAPAGFAASNGLHVLTP